MAVDADTDADGRPPSAPTVLVGRSWPERAMARLLRALRIGVQAAGRGLVAFYNSNNLTFAASIAYYTLLSLFPFILLLSITLSRIALGQGKDAVERVIERALPRQFEFLSAQVTKLAESPIELSVAGVILTIWAAMGVFGAVTSAINHAWGVEKDHSFFKRELISFLMLLAAGLLMVGTLLLMSAIEVVQARWFADAVARYPSLSILTSFVYRYAPTPLFVLVVGLIYYYVPNAKVRLRDVWVGAILAGVLWRLAFSGFSLLVRESRLDVHGSIATVVIFLIWVYLSAVILLYGAGVTAAYARIRKHLPESAPAAAVRG